MRRQLLGTQGLEVSALGLGCMGLTFGYGTIGEDRAIATVHRALDRGITFFDSSDHYGPKTNEVLLGKALAGRREQVQLATKFGTYSWEQPPRVPDGRPEHVREAVDASLTRLGTDYIDLYYQHRVDPQVPIEETVGAMAELVTAGKVRYLGLSEASGETIRRAHRVHPIAAIQPEHSLWSREVEAEVVPVIQELGIGFTPYAPLGRGFLTGAINSLQDLAENDFRRVAPRFQGDNFAHNWEMVERVKTVAARHDATSAQVALAWVLQAVEGSVPIPGTTRPERIDENVKALDLVLSDDDRKLLEADFEAAGTRWPAPMMAFVNG
ncbi:aldo/keto reductase [Actinoplanes sp. L3-i22]|uniref:aldo/keto reductase n=1 Tax=Actinoplanes sp. L3-i22 TaxID=2836373 RepID=UPI001C74016D|nr:aldo/keto reductase [Actinoplanes sp. L3-i22]BCY08843.1 oxidoreductase [Actinoplanes sp. L3-i22]